MSKPIFSIIGTIGISFLTAFPLCAQISAQNGFDLPANGTIRILLVFAQVDCSGPCPQNFQCQPDNTDWPPDSLPTDAGTYFDFNLPAGQAPQGYVTRFYHEASFGNYVVLGGVYPEIITVDCNTVVGAGANGARAVIDSLNTRPTPPNFNWNAYDLVQNETLHGSPKNQGPNGTIDAIHVVWRNNQGDCYAGLGMQELFAGQVIHGFNTIMGASVNSCRSGEDGYGMFIGEYLHGLFGDNNWHTGNGAGFHTFMNPTGSFSLTGQGEASAAVMACAWDRYHLGWQNPAKAFLTSALEGNGSEVNTEMLTLQSTMPAGGEFILRDFYTTGDAIRIRLPHIDWTANGDVKNQYLWLENHRRLSDLDRGQWEGNGCREDLSPGLYAYIQVGKDAEDLGLTAVADLFPNETLAEVERPNAQASWLFPLSAEGHFDFQYGPLQPGNAGLCCNWGWDNIPTDPTTKPNPFTGYSDLFQFQDHDNDGALYSGVPGNRLGGPTGDFAIRTGFSKIIDDTVMHNCHYKGDGLDAFGLACNPELSIATNPASITVYTYRSADEFEATQFDIDNFENRAIWLNGISVEILEENVNPAQFGDGAIRLRIRFDDYTVDKPVRWCGNILLSPHDFDSTLASLVVAPNAEVLLERGLSPTQHFRVPGSALFTEKTRFTCLPDALVTVQGQGRIRVNQGSTFLIQSNSRVSLEPEAEMLVQGSSVLQIEAGGVLEIAENARLIIEDYGKLYIDPNASLILHRGAQVLIKNQGEWHITQGNANHGITFTNTPLAAGQAVIKVAGKIITPSTLDFHFTGPGLLRFEPGNRMQLGPGRRLIIEGQGKTDRIMALSNGASLYIDGHEVALNRLKVDYGAHTSIRLENNKAAFQSVTFEGVSGTGQTAIMADHIIDLSIRDADFKELNIGVDLNNTSTTISTYPIYIANSSFTGCHTAIKVDRVERLLSLNDNVFQGNGNNIGVEAIASPDIHSNNCQFTKFDKAVKLEDVYAFYFIEGEISHCNVGISGHASNVFIRDKAVIRDCSNATKNAKGIEMYGSPPNYSMLTIGDRGCGYIIDNDIGIGGKDIVLNIDAEVHACARGNCLFNIPNRFDGNQLIFDVCYVDFIPVGIDVKGNYWGDSNGDQAGDPLLSFNYNLAVKNATTKCYNTIPVFDNHETDEPEHCTCMGCPVNVHRDINQPILVKTMSNQPYQSKQTLGEAYSNAYQDFLTGAYKSAYHRFADIGQLPLEPEEYTHQTEHHIRASRILAADTGSLADGQPSNPGGKMLIEKETVDEGYWNNRFTISPNPVHHQLKIHASVSGEYHLRLINMLGQEVFHSMLTGNLNDLDVSRLNKGIYFLEISDENQSRLTCQKVLFN